MPTKVLTITSPYSLSTQETAGILSAMGIKKTNSVEVKNLVDKSLLAGFIIKYDSYYLDYSLGHKLKEVISSLVY